jgi:hypothetical protein
MIKHEAFNKIVIRDYGKSFNDILNKRTFKEFIDEIENISGYACDYGYSDSEIEDEVRLGSYKFIGDLFEIFAEVFFIQYKSDNRIGIYDYTPASSENDNGVDGFGKNLTGLPTTVQVKYRGNPTYELKERDLKQFGYQSIVEYGIDYKQSGNMVVFTNCEGLHWYTNTNVFKNKIRVINGDMISRMIDNNEGFWKNFKDIVTLSVKEIGVDKLTEIFINQNEIK